MVRKVFWLLWITVWPALALYPHLVTAQGPARKPADKLAAATIIVDAPDIANIPAEPQAKSAEKVPSQTISQPAPVPESIERLPEIVDSQKPPAATAEQFEESAESATDELLPTARSRKPATTRQPVAGTRLNRKTVPELTTQEEKAQALIFERAVQRGLQRQARLDLKYRSKYTQNTTSSATRWQPHLTETNWVAGTRKQARP